MIFGVVQLYDISYEGCTELALLTSASLHGMSSQGGAPECHKTKPCDLLSPEQVGHFSGNVRISIPVFAGTRGILLRTGRIRKRQIKSPLPKNAQGRVLALQEKLGKYLRAETEGIKQPSEGKLTTGMLRLPPSWVPFMSLTLLMH